MIPHELTSKKIKLKETDNHTIVLVTSNSIGHRRFAYRIQKEFGDLVLAWYQLGNPNTSNNIGNIKKKLSLLYKKINDRLFTNYKIENLGYYSRNKGLMKIIKKAFFLSLSSIYSVIIDTYLFQKQRRRQISCEKRLFHPEIEELRQYSKLLPITVQDPNSKQFIGSIKKLNSYFLLSLDIPFYKKELLENVRGIVINHHVGWSPTYKGSHTIEWALYHRDLNHLGSTVHIASTGTDANKILRRSHPCLIDTDTPESCFSRVVALGTELIIEVVREIMANKEIIIYDQHEDQGMTYESIKFDGKVLRYIYRDFSKNWLKKEISRIKNF